MEKCFLSLCKTFFDTKWKGGLVLQQYHIFLPQHVPIGFCPVKSSGAAKKVIISEMFMFNITYTEQILL